jgi:hypothetical protein
MQYIMGWLILNAIYALLLVLGGINHPPQSVCDEVDHGIGEHWAGE